VTQAGIGGGLSRPWWSSGGRAFFMFLFFFYLAPGAMVEGNSMMLLTVPVSSSQSRQSAFGPERPFRFAPIPVIQGPIRAAQERSPAAWMKIPSASFLNRAAAGRAPSF
jgi:hypothetical protein